MPQIVLCALIGLLFLLYRWGYFAAGDAAIIIQIRDGKAVVERGRLSPEGRHRLEDIARESQVRQGKILISRQRKVTFSREFPEEGDQPIRNVLGQER